MVLVVGGMAAGKTAYVMQTYGYDTDSIADGVLDERPVLDNLQDLVRADPDGCLDLVPVLVQKAVVICNEVGSGVIPVDAEARRWREATGRLCVALAQRADRVVRLVCGVPSVLKGD